MPEVLYGSSTIQYAIEEKDGLKSHYISVQKGVGVVLKGKAVPLYKADQLILKKASWILNKLDLVKHVDTDEIVTGSRIAYLGRKYYVEIIFDSTIKRVLIEFNYSQFKIKLNPFVDTQLEITKALQQFYKAKAIEKITPRIQKLSKEFDLSYNQLKFLKLEKRWGSCTDNNNIILNTDAVKLPYSLIDYLILHELCHTKIKNHSKEYWALLSKFIPNWKDLDEKINLTHF